MPFGHSITIKSGGSPLESKYASALQECVVDQNLYLPDHLMLQFQDHHMELTDSAIFDIGKPVTIEVKVSQESGEIRAILFDGEVTALEPEFDAANGHSLMVRGYTKNWRGLRGSQQKTYLNQKDSQVIQTIISELGLSPDVETTAAVHDFLAQDNQSNTEFLVERAQRIGYKVFTSDSGKLSVKKAEAKTETLTLAMGTDLQSFRPSATAANQVDKVTVKGWDPKKKEVITGSAASSKSHPQINIGGSGGAVAKKAFGAAELVIVDQPVLNASDAEKVAQGRLDRINGAFVQAEGRALGNPKIKPGKELNLTELGRKFSGKYIVSSANHVYSERVYETTFTVAGIKTNTFAELINNQESTKRWAGVLPAVVTNVQDPDNLGRIKVKYSWMADSFESDWARIATPNAGNERGFQWLPEVDDEVLVAFENGIIYHPYIIGSLWNTKDKPPLPSNQAVQGGKVVKRMFKSRKGHIILFDDTDGKEMIKIITQSEKHSITLDDSKNNIVISSDGKATATIESSGKVTIQGDQDITIDTKANMNLKSKGNMTLEATGNVKIEAKANLNLKGIQLTAEGTAMATLKAPTVSVAGSALTEVKGGLVKIN